MAKIHMQKNEKLGNATGNTVCNAKATRGGWMAMAYPRAEFAALKPEHQCAKCAAHLKAAA